MSEVINWKKHAKLFIELFTAGKVNSIRAYCDLHDLNYNSARKHLRAPEAAKTGSLKTGKITKKQSVKKNETVRKKADPHEKENKTTNNQKVTRGSATKKTIKTKHSDPLNNIKKQTVKGDKAGNISTNPKGGTKKINKNQSVTVGLEPGSRKRKKRNIDNNQIDIESSPSKETVKIQKKSDKNKINQSVNEGSVGGVALDNEKTGLDQSISGKTNKNNRNQEDVSHLANDSDNQVAGKKFLSKSWNGEIAELIVPKSGRQSNGRFAKGNLFSVKHGFYQQEKYKSIKETIAAASDIESTLTMEGDLLTELLTQFSLTKQLQNDSLLSMSKLIDAMERDRRVKQIGKKGKGTEVGEVFPINSDDNGNPLELSMLKVTLDSGYALSQLSGSISTVFDRIHQRKIKHRNLRLKERAADIIEDAYLQRSELGASALDMARYIESRGVKVPKLLQKEAELELAKQAADLDNNNNVDDDFLEEAARKYEQAKADRALTLLEKREILAEIMASGKYSDFSENGVKQAEKSTLPVDEIDFEATRELYDDGEDD